MNRWLLWLLLSLFIFAPLVWSASVSQRTEGACSPTITDVKGSVNMQITCTGLDPAFAQLLSKYLKELPRIEQKINQMREEVLQAITSKALDTKQIEELIALKHKVIFASSEEDAKRWAKELLESSSRKESEVKSLAASGRELADKLLLRWNPVYEFFLKEFDNRISALKQTGLIGDSEQTKADLLVVDSESRPVPIRRMKFLGTAAGSFFIVLFQGQIHRGNLITPPHIRLEEYVNGAIYIPIILFFRQEAISLEYRNETQQPPENKPLEATGEDPLSNQEFRRALSTAIGNSISFVYLNSAASR